MHTVDMLVHRWDLASALQTPLTVPAALAQAPLPLARANTGPGSPLNQPGGAYRPPFTEDPANSVMDTIVALLWPQPPDGPPKTTNDKQQMTTTCTQDEAWPVARL